MRPACHLPVLRSRAMIRFLGTLLLLSFSTQLAAAEEKAFRLSLRDRVAGPSGNEKYDVRRREQTWDPTKTAIIVCDMWDSHHCKRAVDRVGEVAPRMNEVLIQA